jgi:hypothetical protein
VGSNTSTALKQATKKRDQNLRRRMILVKTRKGLVSLVLTVVMVAALLIPMVGPASASCTYSMTTTNSITPGTNGAVTNSHIGNLVVAFDVPTFQSSAKMVYMSLPSTPGGYQLYIDGAAAQANLASELGLSDASTGNALLAYKALVNNNVLYAANNTTPNALGSSFTALTAIPGADPTTSCLTLNTSYNIASGVTFSNALDLAGMSSVTLSIPVYITVPSGVAGGPVILTTNAQSSSAFTGGASITVANVKVPSVTLAAESAPALSSSGNQISVIDLKENTSGALQTTDSSPSLSLTLPAGFTWGAVTASTMWGAGSTPAPSYFTALTSAATQQANGYIGYTTTANNGQELDFYSQGYGSSSGYFIKLAATVNIDSSTAQSGPIAVTIGGETTSTVSNITVGNYGAYGATSAASSTVPTIIAGKAASSTGELEIKESAPGSLVIGRSITLTLPSNVMWAKAPSVDPVLSTNLGGLTGLNGYSVASDWNNVGATGNEIQATVTGTATTGNAADIFLKNIEVTPAVDFAPGPLTVTIGGTEGLTGTATLANVAAGVTAAAGSTPTVEIGQTAQTLGDLTITEAAAGNISATATYSDLTNQEIAEHTSTPTQSEIDVYAPVGVTFYATPTVTVASGNLHIGTISTSTTADNQGELVIPIQNASTSASTIKIAAPQVTIDRTVPDGPIVFKVKGNAIDQTEPADPLPANTTVLFPNDTTAASVTVANLGATTTATTPAGAVVFTIGQASYTANGSPVTVDVAPYIKDSRTFLPLRAVAEALGVPDSNIMYDQAAHKVTIIKGSTVVQLTIGSTGMLLNGASVTMDTAPEIESGRTCLPVAWVAKALGASITWDATAQTVTITAE